MPRWLLQVLIAVDQLINALLWGFADETLSARAWRMQHRSRRWGFARRLFDALLGPEHCFESYISERLRAQSPPEERPTP